MSARVPPSAKVTTTPPGRGHPARAGRGGVVQGWPALGVLPGPGPTSAAGAARPAAPSPPFVFRDDERQLAVDRTRLPGASTERRGSPRCSGGAPSEPRAGGGPPAAVGCPGAPERLDKLVLLGERHLHLAVADFLEHYHVERNHQGLDNQLITTTPLVARPANDNSPVVRRERLGGLLSFYHRRAAQVTAWPAPPRSSRRVRPLLARRRRRDTLMPSGFRPRGDRAGDGSRVK